MEYKNLGVKIGLEIHQQLDSGTKLFCNCPIMRSQESPLEIRRMMRAIAGETGKVDTAAEYEQSKSKTYIYKYNTESSCLIELDEQPPIGPNSKALDTTLQTCKLLGCDIVDELHFMRKNIIDGSVVSAFQRTGMVGLNGNIKTSFGNVGIQTVMLEEDASTSMGKTEMSVEYRLDRQGIPLIEIATDPSIQSPKHAQETAETIGLLLRSLPVVRGIGSIRQDINVSIAQGARVEIKGFQELEKIADAVENEIKRQVALVEIKKELEKRGFKQAKTEYKDVTEIFKDTKMSVLTKAIAAGGKIFAAKLPKFKGLLIKQLGDRTLGKELSTYADMYGYGIIHSEEERADLHYEFNALRKELKAGEEDDIFISAGKDPAAAMEIVLNRANYCSIGVPEETRNADGIGSKFMRPLPGAGRLYPESDIQPIFLADIVDKIKTPKTLLEKKKEMKLPEELADQMIKSRYLHWYEELSHYGEVLVASTLLNTFKDLSRRGLDIGKIKREDLGHIFVEIKNKKISKDSVLLILEQYLMTGKDIRSAVKDFYMLTDKELKDSIKMIVSRNPSATENALMGLAMKNLRGRADGEKIVKLVREYLRK
ncbi:MAG: Glu-tRNA(Gln) amidotransferase subunit GatE [Candidatus Aenigmarchaeota archaeon]|nr:Glu-tRNA(Gln) amidotransferase subunit GatE [Candidatus Aenigmarchaeota archaeon]